MLEWNLPVSGAIAKGKHFDEPAISDAEKKEKEELFHSFKAHFSLRQGGLSLAMYYIQVDLYLNSSKSELNNFY